MKAKIIELTEFETKDYQDLPNWDLNKARNLEKFLETNFSSILGFGLKSLKASHYVGSIRYEDLQIDIYPKYLARDKRDKTTSIRQLIKMLKYTKQLEIDLSDADAQKFSDNSFLEILIYYYAKTLFESLKRHNPHHYQDKEENLNTIRGRIDFVNNIKYNLANKARIFCCFQDFTSDNLLNRTLYFVSNLLYRQTQNKESKQMFKQIFALYDDITLIPITFEQTKKIRLSKQQQKFFSTPFRLAQVFLEHSNINLYKNTLKDFAILFDMNKLFEEFVYEKLKEEYEEKSVETQKSKFLIKGFTSLKDQQNLYIDTKKYIRTDILIKDGSNVKYIIDTKYKNPKEISSADIYQMLAYARIYKNTKNLILIYPKHLNHYQCKANFCQDIEKDLNLQVVTIDLTQDIDRIRIKNMLSY